jgi:hypothetical protein
MPEKYTKRTYKHRKHCEQPEPEPEPEPEYCKPKRKCAVKQARKKNVRVDSDPPIIPLAETDPRESSIKLKDNVFQFEEAGAYLVSYELYTNGVGEREAALYTFHSNNCSSHAPCGGCPVSTVPTFSSGGNIVPCSKSYAAEGDKVIRCIGVLVNIQQPCTRMALYNEGDTITFDADLNPNTFVSIVKVASCDCN